MGALKTDDVIKGVLDLAKTAQELENVKKEHHELSQQIGQLENNLNVLKRANKEEREAFDKLKKEKQEYMDSTTQEISKLQNSRASLSASLAPEVAQLNSLKSQLEGFKNEISNKDKELNDKYNMLSKNQSEFEEKKNIVKQIKELAEKL